ncbi:MAG: ABC transporter permease [Trueperaceae bacterium]|nr:ABC transporter permease [Trueperaceae bacterium]
MASASAKTDERVRELSWFNRLLSRPEFGALSGAILVFVMFTIFAWDASTNSSGFLGWRAVVTWLKFSAEIGIIGIGATLLMIGGEFDLSVGSIIGMTSLILLAPIVLYGWAPWQAILLTLAVAVLLGWINGTLVNATGLPSFIVTLAFLYIYRGLTLVVTRALTGGATRVDIQALVGQNGIADVPQAREFIRSDRLAQLFSGEVWLSPKIVGFLGNIGLIPIQTRNVLDPATGQRTPMDLPIIDGIPVAVGWWIGLTILAIILLQRTQLGNWIFGTGGHAESARNMGVPTNRVKILLFMGTALCGTILSILQVFEAGSSEVLRGQLKEFEAIIVAVIGGTLLTGGYGSVAGAFWGALIYGMIARGTEIVRWMPNDWFRIFLGVGLLAAVLFNTYIRKRATEAK